MTPPDLKARAKPVAEPPAPKLAARLVTVEGEWITEALPPREHLLTDNRTGKGAIDKAGAWLFAAAGGAGKSYGTIDLGLAVAAGGTWLGTFQTSGRPGRVLLVVVEDTAEDVRRRMKRIADAMGYRAADIAGRVQMLPLKGTFTSLVRQDRNLGTYVMGDGLADLREFLAAQRAEHGAYDLVVIDPIARVAGLSLDKDSEAASKFIDALDVLSEAAGGLVLGVSHTNKTSRKEGSLGKPAEATDVRGSTALTDGVRGVISLEPLVDANRKRTGRVVLSLTKGNHIRRWDDVILERDENGVLVPLDEVDRAIFEAERKGQTSEERRAAREAERKARLDAQATADLDRAAIARAATRARKEAEAQAQVEADAATVRRLMADGRAGKLRDRVKVALACGSPRADRAIARVQEDSRAPGSVPPHQLPKSPHTPLVLGGTEAPGVPSGAPTRQETEAPQGTAGHRGTGNEGET